MKKLYLLLSITIGAIPLIQGMETPDIFELTASEASQSSSSSGRNTAPHVIMRDDFFADVVGMPENTFRHKYGYHQGKLQRPPKDLAQWIKKYPRRAALFQGKFTFETIETMDQIIGRHIQPLTPNATFSILIHDPNNPQEDDIRFMQSLPSNKDASFQLASTFFGPLEGGMWDWNKELTDMLHAAAQGEEASISTAPATIYRKYFMPQLYYLLYNLKDKLPMDKHSTHGAIDMHAAEHYTLDPRDIKKVGFGIHKDIVVTSGFGQTTRLGQRGTQQRNDIVFNQDGTINLMHTPTVTQIFTSAYSMIQARKLMHQGKMTPAEYKHVESLAQMLLQASYQGTVKAAYVAGTPKLYLTLMGGGAFRNDIAWIADALEQKEFLDFIKKSGLQVTIIFRIDKKRDDQVRNANDDLVFVHRLLGVADTINGTNWRNDTAINTLFQSYVREGYKATFYNDKQAEKTYAQVARQLKPLLLMPQQQSFHGYKPVLTTLPFLASTTAASQSSSPSVSSGWSTAPITSSTVSRSFTYYMTLSNGETVGWLYIPKYKDSVLVNIKKNKQPEFNKSTGALNFTFINPDVPSVALPAGLYFWQSQNKKPELGNHRNKTKVRNYPDGRDFEYNKTHNDYVNAQKSHERWDSKKHSFTEYL